MDDIFYLNSEKITMADIYTVANERGFERVFLTASGEELEIKYYSE